MDKLRHEIKRINKYNLEYYNSLLDKDGYIKLQLWEAFEYFGDSMNIGIGGLHANEFYLETKHLDNCG